MSHCGKLIGAGDDGYPPNVCERNAGHGGDCDTRLDSDVLCDVCGHSWRCGGGDPRAAESASLRARLAEAEATIEKLRDSLVSPQTTRRTEAIDVLKRRLAKAEGERGAQRSRAEAAERNLATCLAALDAALVLRGAK